MGASYLIGVDVGSTSTKATLFDVDGTALGDARRESRLRLPRPGVAEYDGEQLFGATLATLRDVLEQSRVAPARVAAICLDGMISGTMGVDKEGEATTPYTTTLDTRFMRWLNDVLARFGRLIRQHTGSGQPCIGPKMMWVRDEFPSAYRRSAKFVTITGYLTGKLGGLRGNDAFIDYTHLWATGLSNTSTYSWSEELCDALQLPLSKLPRIVSPSEIVGGVCDATARATGLVAGTPIVAGAGDQSAGFVGAGITQRGRMGDAAGTYPVLSLCTDAFRPDLDTQLTEIVPSVLPGLWNPTSLIIGGGLTHRWFGETFADGPAMLEGLAEHFRLLDEQARQVAPGSDRLVFVPHLGGRACPTRSNYRGAWVGFTWAHRRQHFYRALLESIAYDQYLALGSLRAAYPEAHVNEIVVYGGGAGSDLWNEIKADVMGIPYVRFGRDDLASLGAAILAGYAVGLYSDVAATAERFVERGTRYVPRPERHGFYRQYAEGYGRLLSGLETCYDDLARLPAWEAM